MSDTFDELQAAQAAATEWLQDSWNNAVDQAQEWVTNETANEYVDTVQDYVNHGVDTLQGGYTETLDAVQSYGEQLYEEAASWVGEHGKYAQHGDYAQQSTDWGPLDAHDPYASETDPYWISDEEQAYRNALEEEARRNEEEAWQAEQDRLEQERLAMAATGGPDVHSAGSGAPEGYGSGYGQGGSSSTSETPSGAWE